MRIFFVAFLLSASGAYAQTDSDRTGFPVTIVETSEQATHNQELERKSDAHDAADLNAQVRAANAAERSAATAERQEVPALAQIVIGVSSTVIAMVALFISVWTFRQGSRTIQAQLRAYIVIDTGVLIFQRQRLRFEARPIVFNTGQTPAQNVRMVARTVLVKMPFPENFDFTVKDPGAATTFTLGPDKSRFTKAIAERKFTIGELRAIHRVEAAILCYGTVWYKDVFGRGRFTNFSYVIHGRRRGETVWRATSANNDSN